LVEKHQSKTQEAMNTIKKKFTSFFGKTMKNIKDQKPEKKDEEEKDGKEMREPPNQSTS